MLWNLAGMVTPNAKGIRNPSSANFLNSASSAYPPVDQYEQDQCSQYGHIDTTLFVYEDGNLAHSCRIRQLDRMYSLLTIS